MQDKNFNVGGEAVKFAATTVSINGEQKDIIPAFTKYSINRKDLSKNKILENIDKNKILPTLFAFTGTKPFRDDNIVLFDYNGVEIPQELDENVLVSLDKPDTINLFGVLDAPFNSAMVECDSVAEAYSRVATTFAISQMPQKDKWIGLGIATTKDNVLSQILQFANDNKMNGTTAQAYFDLSYNVSSLKKAAMTMVSPLGDAEYRSMDNATKLFQATEKAFGARYAVQTRYVKALNTSIGLYSFEDVVESLNAIEEVDKQKIIGAPSDKKSQYIQDFITGYIKLRNVKNVE